MTDSKVLVQTLHEIDPQFTALCDTLFGAAVDPGDVWGYLYTREGVAKMSPAPSDVATKGGRLARKVVASAKNPNSILGYNVRGGVFRPVLRNRGVQAVSGGVVANQLPQSGKRTEKLVKNESSVVWDVEFSKVDEEKRQVFGWASIVKMDGQDVVDRQGDYISPEEIEKAAYSYVVKSRTGGHQHKRTADGAPFKASDMIESIVFTPEKISKMGLPDTFPSGWWVGYKIFDEDTWQKVKKGDVTGFSIHGRGRRQEA